MKPIDPYDHALRVRSLVNVIEESDSPREREAARKRLAELEPAPESALASLDADERAAGGKWRESKHRMPGEEVIVAKGTLA